MMHRNVGMKDMLMSIEGRKKRKHKVVKGNRCFYLQLFERKKQKSLKSSCDAMYESSKNKIEFIVDIICKRKI